MIGFQRLPKLSRRLLYKYCTVHGQNFLPTAGSRLRYVNNPSANERLHYNKNWKSAQISYRRPHQQQTAISYRTVSPITFNSWTMNWRSCPWNAASLYRMTKEFDEVFLLLENPKKSNNLGPILRCAAAFGIRTVVFVWVQFISNSDVSNAVLPPCTHVSFGTEKEIDWRELIWTKRISTWIEAKHEEGNNLKL